jgi:hypothetical protein
MHHRIKPMKNKKAIGGLPMAFEIKDKAELAKRQTTGKSPPPTRRIFLRPSHGILVT